MHIDTNVFKTTQSFRYQWFRVSIHQANATKHGEINFKPMNHRLTDKKCQRIWCREIRTKTAETMLQGILVEKIPNHARIWAFTRWGAMANVRLCMDPVIIGLGGAFCMVDSQLLNKAMMTHCRLGDIPPLKCESNTIYILSWKMKASSARYWSFLADFSVLHRLVM